MQHARSRSSSWKLRQCSNTDGGQQRPAGASRRPTVGRSREGAHSDRSEQCSSPCRGVATSWCGAERIYRFGRRSLCLFGRRFPVAFLAVPGLPARLVDGVDT